MTEHSLDNWRIDHFLATEIFRQASGVMSEGGSVQQAFSDGSFSLGNWRDKHLATEVFRQATGVTSERGSVHKAHDRASEETPGRMAEN